MKYNHNLDSLRAIAALAVIGHHLNGIIPFGWVGVQLFFVLSGYLITSILLQRVDCCPALIEYLKHFFYRRSLRLLPLYFLFVGCCSVFYLCFHRPAAFPNAAPYLYTYSLNIARMQPGYDNVPWYSHLWSLAAEWQFYLIWPFFIYYIPRAWVFRFFLVLIVVAPLLRLYGVVWAHELNWGSASSDYRWLMTQIGNFTYNAPWTNLDAFAIGGLLVSVRALNFLSSNVVSLFIFSATLFAGMAVAFYGRAGDLIGFRTLGWQCTMPYFYQSIWGYSLLNLSCASLLAMVISDKPLLCRLLDRGWLHYLGRISYGVYVWHAPLVGLVMEFVLRGKLWYHPLSLILVMPVVFISILCAHFSYNYFEKYFLKVKNSIRLQGAASG